jgi:hypothetical protein
MTLCLEKCEKVYYPITPELEEKAKQGCGGGSRAKFITKEGNPFGLVAGVLFTGDGLNSAYSASRVNFLHIATAKQGEIDNDLWDKLYPQIRTVILAVASDTIESAKGKIKKGDMFTTRYDVETNSLSYDDFFYDKEKEQIYRYETVQ